MQFTLMKYCWRRRARALSKHLFFEEELCSYQWQSIMQRLIGVHERGMTILTHHTGIFLGRLLLFPLLPVALSLLPCLQPGEFSIMHAWLAFNAVSKLCILSHSPMRLLLLQLWLWQSLMLHLTVMFHPSPLHTPGHSVMVRPQMHRKPFANHTALHCKGLIIWCSLSLFKTG